MTDHKELMEQLRSWTSTPTEHEAADAIEALQARIADLEAKVEQQRFILAAGAAPTLEQLIIKENDRVLRESLEGKYAMAQAAPKEQT